MAEEERATSEAVTFQVLGPFGARGADGRPLDLKGPRHRAVLARLLVARRRTVPVSWLVDDLWEDPPPTAVGTIRTFVGALRKALEPARPRRAPARLLVTSGPGYALLAGPGAVDAWRFEEAVREAGRLLQADRPERVPPLLDDALALWRGPAYAEWGDADWARAEVTRLDGLRLLAVERRADAALALGRAEEAVLDLEPHVDRHPWREDAWRLLALALYRAGRQGDALAVLRRARERLLEELGVDPGEGLRRVEGVILGRGVEASRGAPGPPLHRNQGMPPLAPRSIGLRPRPQTPDGLGGASRPQGAGGPEPLLGRDEELAALGAVAHAVVRSGRPALALVRGDAGAGKTALVREAARRLAADGWTTAWGRAPEGGGFPAGWPWTEILTHLGFPEPEPESAPEPKPGADSTLHPTPHPTPQHDPATARFRWQRYVVGRLGAVVGRGRPVLLVLDDLHWAGEETLDLLASLVDEGLPGPVLVVATHRETEVPPALREFLGRVARREPARVRLAGLAEDAVGALVRAVTRLPVDAATARAVHRRSGGNPFFVREIARLYATDGAVALSRVPDGVRDVVRRRLGRLPAGARAVLRQAAVVGPVADLDVLVALAGDEEAVLEGVECAIGAGFLAEEFAEEFAEESVEEVAEEFVGEGAGGERVRFAHALVHETVYRDLSRPRRARLHTAVAEALTALRPDAVDAIAHHYLTAETRPTARPALAYAVAAARRAESAGAPHRAVRLWEGALEALGRVEGAGGGVPGGRGGPAETDGVLDVLRWGAGADEEGAGRVRLGLLMGLVRNLAVGGRLAEARRRRGDALADAERVGDPALLARVIGAFDVPGVWARNDDEDLSRRVVTAAERALGALPDDGTPDRRATRCRLLATIAMETRGQPPGRGADAAREAEALARALGADAHPALLAFALNGRFLHAFHRAGLAPERVRVGTELTALAARHGLVTFEVLGHLMLLQAHGALADFPRADAHASAADALAERYGLPLVGVFTDWYGALRAAVAGRVGEAEAAYRGAAARLRGTGMTGMDRGGELLGAALLCLGVEDGGGGVLGRLVEEERADHLLELRLCLRAREVLSGADVDAGEAASLYRALLPACGELGGAGSGLLTLGPVAQYAGDLAVALGRPAVARDHYRQALAVAERAGARRWADAARGALRGTPYSALRAVRGCPDD
ncbi:BTAD domain-containing putative transcriptional regulator [Streptomyces sp. G45]|uniref:BTAD domain-containing putative transcriptional regulator n=1 Tax=Streptomyces sp. G45 TaxID=3406627 RepID=UPI003C1B64B9